MNWYKNYKTQTILKFCRKVFANNEETKLNEENELDTIKTNLRKTIEALGNYIEELYEGKTELKPNDVPSEVFTNKEEEKCIQPGSPYKICLKPDSLLDGQEKLGFNVSIGKQTFDLMKPEKTVGAALRRLKMALTFAQDTIANILLKEGN